MRQWRRDRERMRKWRDNEEIERENGERMRKWRGYRKRMRKWRERK